MYKRIAVSTSSRLKTEADVFFCTVQEDKIELLSVVKDVDASTRKEVKAMLDWPECAGRSGEVIVGRDGGRRILLIGLGPRDMVDVRTVRAAADGLIKQLYSLKIEKAELHPVSRLPGKEVDLFRSLGEGLGLANFTFDSFKALTLAESTPARLTVKVEDARTRKSLETGLVMAEAANFAREWSATPPNIATTRKIAETARKLAREHKNLSCRVMEGKALETHKMVGLMNVGKASENPPCMIELTHSPGKRPKGCVLLIGKTIVYDTGGLSIKPSSGMQGMKYDKCGGMAVLGAMRAVAEIKPKCKVVALLPTAENCISDEAYRPDDILEYPNGVTVEVTNTDAEGRLVLADALHYGCSKIKPDAIIDIATLTGGVVVALGRTCAGLWCEDEKLRKRLDEAAEVSGEQLWRLPLHEPYREMMKSQHADIWNSAPVREAHPIQGAAFLSYFVDEDVPWAHIDVAGVSKVEKDQPPYCAGPTGFGVLLFGALLERWS